MQVEMLPPLPPSIQSAIEPPATTSSSTTSNTTTTFSIPSITTSNSTSKSSLPALTTIYNTLSSVLLEPEDCSTHFKNQEYDRSGVADSLRKLWLQQAKEEILIAALREVALLEPRYAARPEQNRRRGRNTNFEASSDVFLPPDLRELVYIIASYLSHLGNNDSSDDGNGLASLSRQEIEDLMRDDVEEFRSRAPEIAAVLSEYIVDLERTINEVASLALTSFSSAATTITASSSIPNPSSTTKSKIPSQPSSLTARQRRHLTQQTTSSQPGALQETTTHLLNHLTHQTQNSIPTTLTTLTNSLRSYLKTTQNLLSSHLTTTEQFTHSTQSRNLTTQSEFLATVSAGLKLKAEVNYLLFEREVYSLEGMRGALREYVGLLEGKEGRVRDRGERIWGLLFDAGFESRDLRSSEDEDGNDGGDDSEYVDVDENGGSRVGGSIGETERLLGELGKRYKSIEEEIEIVRRDIERLEGLEENEGGGRRGARRNVK